MGLSPADLHSKQVKIPRIRYDVLRFGIAQDVRSNILHIGSGRMLYISRTLMSRHPSGPRQHHHRTLADEASSVSHSFKHTYPIYHPLPTLTYKSPRHLFKLTAVIGHV